MGSETPNRNNCNWRLLFDASLGGLMRGKIVPTRNASFYLKRSELPPQAISYIRKTLKRSPLFPKEATRATRQLIRQFKRELSAGHSVEQVIARLGTPKEMRKRIFPAMIRRRPWYGRAFHYAGVWSTYAFAIIALCKLSLIAWFYFSRPTFTHDYVADINAPALAVSADERGWTFYREAYLQSFAKPGVELPDIDESKNPLTAEEWDELAAWCDTRREALSKVREGVSREMLGVILGPGGTGDDRELWPTAQLSAERPWYWAIEANFGSVTRSLVEGLRIECVVAARRGDANLALADLDALMRMGYQLRDGTFWGFLNANHALASAQSAAIQILQYRPDVLTDEQWRMISRRFAELVRPNDLCNFENERLLLEQSLQLVYTNDGKGNGRITPDGLLRITGQSADDEFKRLGCSTMAPLALFVMPSRQAVKGRFEDELAEVRQSLSIPYANYEQPTRTSGGFGSVLTDVLFPRLDRTRTTIEQFSGQVDGVRIGIAIELYHRQHGRYPNALTELTPDYIDAVPLDRITGEPLIFRIDRGKPLVYSVGPNGRDDSGKLNITGLNQHPPDNSRDWILYSGHHIPTISNATSVSEDISDAPPPAR